MSWADGSQVREEGRRTVYVVYDGIGYGLPGPEAQAAGGWDPRDVQVVQDGALHSLPTSPPDGTVLREKFSGGAYRIYSGYRLRMLGPAADSMHEHRGLELPDPVIAAIPDAGTYRRPVTTGIGRWVLGLRAFAIRQQPTLRELFWAVAGAAFGLGLAAILGD
jgi:hypothetical protein